MSLEEAKIYYYEDFESAKEPWLKYQEHGSAFQSWQWCYTWFQTVGVHLNVKVLIQELEGVGIIPFVLFNKGPFRIASILGGDGADYLGVCLKDQLQANIHELLDNLYSYWKYDLFYGPKVLNDQSCLLKLTKIPYAENCHQVNLPESFEQWYIEKIKSKVRNDTKRQEKRLSEIGDLKFVVATDEKMALEITNKMIEQKEQRYREWGAPSIFKKGTYAQFYRELGKTFFLMKDGFQVHISALMLGDHIISTHYGVVGKNRFYYQLPAFDLKYGKYSPGKIHLTELIKWSCAQRIEVFDFTVGDEGYKKIWCDQETKLYNCFYIKNIRGLSFYLLIKIKEELKKREKIRDFIFKVMIKIGLK